MQVKLRYKVICSVAIVFFLLNALLSLVMLQPSAFNLEAFVLMGGFPVLAWLILAGLARTKLFWSFFAGSLAIYMLITALTLMPNLYRVAPFMMYVSTALGWIYTLFPLFYFIFRFEQAATILAFAFSPEAKALRQKKSEAKWREERDRVAGINRKAAGQPADIKQAVARAMNRQENKPAPGANRLDLSEAPAAPVTPAPAAAPAVAPAASAVTAAAAVTAPVSGAKIDINRCTADDLLALPGMSPAAAAAAVESRTAKGPYLSEDDFIQRNSIKPHFAVKILPQIQVSAPAAPAAAEAQDKHPAKRRSLDL